MASDASYEGPHAVVSKTRDLVTSNLIASNEDVSYSTGDELSGAAEEAVPEDTRVAKCDCPKCSRG